MTRRKVINKYLDQLFEKAKIRRGEDIGINILIGDKMLYALGHRDGNPKSNYFSRSEFNFIKNMFGLSEGETVEIIREYLANNVEPFLFHLPFHPTL